jgi:hypothetical protein
MGSPATRLALAATRTMLNRSCTASPAPEAVSVRPGINLPHAPAACMAGEKKSDNRKLCCFHSFFSPFVLGGRRGLCTARWKRSTCMTKSSWDSVGHARENGILNFSRCIAIGAKKPIAPASIGKYVHDAYMHVTTAPFDSAHKQNRRCTRSISSRRNRNWSTSS